MKVVLDVTAEAKKPEDVNKGLERAARLLNLYGVSDRETTNTESSQCKQAGGRSLDEQTHSIAPRRRHVSIPSAPYACMAMRSIFCW